MRYLYIYIFLIFIYISVNSQVSDTVLVSEKNETYIEFTGSLSICDIGIYGNEEKKVKKDSEKGTITLETDNYTVNAMNGIATVKANKQGSLPVKLFIRSSSQSLQLNLKYSKGNGDIYYYNYAENSLNTGKGETKRQSKENPPYSYAEVKNLPEKIDIEKRRELLKYDEGRTNQKLDFFMSLADQYSGIGKIKNDISFSVVRLANDSTHFYLKLRAENGSNVGYRLESTVFNYVKVSKDRIFSKKNEAGEELNNVIKREDLVISGGNHKYFGYAIPIFALDKKSYIRITINEFQGKRNFEIRAPAKKINKSDKL